MSIITNSSSKLTKQIANSKGMILKVGGFCKISLTIFYLFIYLAIYLSINVFIYLFKLYSYFAIYISFVSKEQYVLVRVNIDKNYCELLCVSRGIQILSTLASSIIVYTFIYLSKYTSIFQIIYLFD